MESDSAYRQGTVLGLTIAEMFILLLFLLLVAFLGFADHADQWQKELQKLPALEQRLYEWRDVIESHTPDEIKTLTSKAPMFEEQTRELDQFRKENEVLQEEKEQWQKERETLKKQTEKSDNLRKENEKLKAEKERWQREQEAWEKQIGEAKQEATQARKELQKGELPKCWYEVVKDEEGNPREKAHYLFNVAVHDDHMVVQRREPPSGQADDDNVKGLTYAEEARRLLPLADIPFDKPLGDKELDQYMRPIYDMGKNKEVRSYSCIFYVKVCDKTSKDKKDRWKTAHDGVLEGLFGTFEAKNEAWCPGSP